METPIECASGVVQEPALTLLRRAGARVLMNGMDLEDARHYLGGSFEFMGVAVRAKEIEQRRPEMVALAKALADALRALRGMTGEQLVGMSGHGLFIYPYMNRTWHRAC